MLENTQKLETYKDGRYLVFDFGDKCVRYDLGEKQAYGFSGKPVKNIKLQLRSIPLADVFTSCKDRTYAELLRYIKNNEPGTNNIGTLLERLPRYNNFEQFLSAGVSLPSTPSSLTSNIRDVKKGCIKFFRKFNIPATDQRIKLYNQYPDFYDYLASEEWYGFEVEDIRNFLTPYCMSSVAFLMDARGYDKKALLRYLDRLEAYEGLSILSGSVRELSDYANMMRAISPKFDKYPKNFRTTFNIMQRNYTRLNNKYDEDKFKEMRRDEYNKRIGDYVVIYPKTTQDIKDEAVQMHNCVASYIDKVLRNECHILFLRKASEPDKSLVTLEVRDGKVVQALRAYNEPLLKEDIRVLDVYNKYLKTL